MWDRQQGASAGAYRDMYGEWNASDGSTGKKDVELFISMALTNFQFYKNYTMNSQV